VRDWWRDALAGGVPPTAGRRRGVVLRQALILLTGMRIDEALEALADDVEGHWLLIRESKTHQPRILYLSRQALGIVHALHAASRQRCLFEVGDGTSKYLAAWNHTQSFWHQLVRECKGAGTHDPGEKRHQSLRRMMSTWLYKRDPVAESAQLGHGSGVVMKHYLDVIRRLPKILDKYRLPDLDVEGFSWPQPIDAGLQRPDRLYAEFRKLVSRRRR